MTRNLKNKLQIRNGFELEVYMPANKKKRVSIHEKFDV